MSANTLQLGLVGLGLSKLVLLLALYAARASQSASFLCTVLDELVLFRLLVVLLVVAEAVVGVLYVRVTDRGRSLRLLALTLAGAGLSVAGWVVMTSTPQGEQWHRNGTIVYGAGTLLYSYCMEWVKKQWSGLLLLAQVAIIVLLIAMWMAFFAGLSDDAARLEWFLLMAQAGGFALFFALHDFSPAVGEDERGGVNVPLMPV